MTARLNLAIGAAAVLAMCAASTARADNEKGTAVVKGKVVFEGDPPPMKALPPMNADPVCAKAHTKAVPDQALIVYKNEGNAIPYVFVYVKSGLKGKYDTPKEPVTIDQKGCQYTPHVFGMIAGQQLDIRSSDPTAHNIHALPKKNTEFNLSQPNIGVISRTGGQTFTKPEQPIKFKCDVHSWMSAWCHVMTHPFFAVTKDHDEFPGKDEDGKELPENKARWGTFEIKDLPAGEYELEAWHETFGTATQKVTIKDGETKEIEFKLGPKKGAGVHPERTVILASDTGGDAKPACCAAGHGARH